MKRLFLICGFLLVATGAMACDTYTSVQKAPGVRILTDEGVGLTVTDNGEKTAYTTSSAGTGTGVRVAFVEGGEPLEIEANPGEFWLGPEKFTEFCRADGR
jgi:hypothetical protein